MPPRRKRNTKPVSKPVSKPADEYGSESEDESQALLDEQEQKEDATPLPVKKSTTAKKGNVSQASKTAKTTSTKPAGSQQKTAKSVKPVAARGRTTKSNAAVQTRKQKSKPASQPITDTEDSESEEESEEEPEEESEEETLESFNDIPKAKKATTKRNKSLEPKKGKLAKNAKPAQKPKGTLRGVAIASNSAPIKTGTKRKASNEEGNTVAARKRSKKGPSKDSSQDVEGDGLESFYGPLDNLPQPDKNIKIPPLSKFKKSFENKTVANRVEQLDRMFKNGEIAKEQTENYRAIVKAYRDGTMPEGGAVFAGGTRTTLQEAKPEMGYLWAESRYNPQLLNSNGVPRNSIATYPWNPYHRGHLVYVAVRLSPDYGGNPTRIRYISFIYDTGSGALTLNETDISWFEQGLTPWPNGDLAYYGYMPDAWFSTLGGDYVRQMILVEVALLDAPGAHGSFLTPWLRETACIVPKGYAYVTGLALRRSHYIGHGPLDLVPYLVVAGQKKGFVNTLP